MIKPSYKAPPLPDHRIATAEKRRVRMRARLLDAVMHVYADLPPGRVPSIDEVVTHAQVSRGTFYKYFLAVDEAVIALGTELGERLTHQALPHYDVLTEPWQRVAVGLRGWLTYAVNDPVWARFVTRIDVWPHLHVTRNLITQDVSRGRDLGQFSFSDSRTAVDMVCGIAVTGIYALRAGIDDPQGYIDCAVSMILAALGCDPDSCQQGVEFSRRHQRIYV